MRRRHPRATRTDTLFPDTTLFRSAFAFLNVQHQGARNTRFDTAAADNRHLAAYTLVNARVGVSAPNWSVELFAENIGRSRGQPNRIFYPFSLNATTQVEVVTPRTTGIELTLRRRPDKKAASDETTIGREQV